MTSNQRFRNRSSVIMLGFLAMLGPVAHDIFIPNIPNIALGLNTTANLVSVSISSIFFGSAIGTLFHGVLADHFGRKLIILWVLAVYVISAAVAGFSTSIELLIVSRFFQGLALSGGRVLSAAVARDLFDKAKLGSVMSDIMFITAIAAVVAPILGGLTANNLPWQSSLFFMGLFGTCVFITFCIFFKESLDPNIVGELHVRKTFKDLCYIAGKFSFQMYSLCGGLMLAGFVVFLSFSANIIIQSYGVDAETYGVMFASVSGCYLIGTFIAGRLAVRMGLDKMIRFGVVVGLLGGLFMLIGALIDYSVPAALILPMGIFVLGLAYINPISIAGSLQPFPELAGSASSLTNFIRGIIGAGVSFGASFFPHEDSSIVATIIFALGCLAILVYYFGIRNITLRS